MIENVHAADAAPIARSAPAFRIHEDWLAVIFGGTVLLLALAGGIPSLPALRWGGPTPRRPCFPTWYRQVRSASCRRSAW
jgi:hypothetical protein